jgi:DNA-binding NtrC family response regulator
LYIIDIWLEQPSFWLIKDIRSKTDKPIAVYSAYNNIDYVTKSFLSGADQFFDKIVTPRSLVYKSMGLMNMYNRIKNNTNESKNKKVK